MWAYFIQNSIFDIRYSTFSPERSGSCIENISHKLGCSHCLLASSNQLIRGLAINFVLVTCQMSNVFAKQISMASTRVVEALPHDRQNDRTSHLQLIPSLKFFRKIVERLVGGGIQLFNKSVLRNRGAPLRGDSRSALCI